MTGIVTVQAGLVLAAMTAQSSVEASTGMKVRLTTTASSASTAGTELSGTGYTAGGQACSFNAPVTGSPPATCTSSTVLTWTNTSGVSWSIVSGELWDQAGSPLRWWFWNWTGQPIVIANGNTFQVSSAGISLTLA